MTEPLRARPPAQLRDDVARVFGYQIMYGPDADAFDRWPADAVAKFTRDLADALLAEFSIVARGDTSPDAESHVTVLEAIVRRLMTGRYDSPRGDTPPPQTAALARNEGEQSMAAALAPFGWTCTEEFWRRYYSDAWVFNLANAVERLSQARAAVGDSTPARAEEDQQ